MVIGVVGVFGMGSMQGGVDTPPSPGSDGASRETEESYRSSPVDFFRELLAMSPQARRKALAGKGKAQQEVLRRKIEEYQSLPEAQREVRLKVVELHWYLDPLLEKEPSERERALGRIPPEDRPLVEERLRQWEKLPAHVRAKVAEDRRLMGFFLRHGVLYANVIQETQGVMPPHPKYASEETASEREEEKRMERLTRHLKRFFDLPKEERRETLGLLAEGRRGQARARLEIFDNLSPRMRQECVHSLVKYSRMTEAEQERFLANVERWEAMSASQREAWRGLVKRLPPLPPGMTLKEASLQAPPIPGKTN